jgi:hypothetical protein
MHARATLGEGSLSLPLDLGWANKDININDPFEVELASRLQLSALAHVAGSTSRAYVGPWSAFVIWCGSLMRPRKPLPEEDITVALYFQSQIYKADPFSTIKSTSASIAFFHKINLFPNHPNITPKVCMAITRKFGLSAKRFKEPFLWSQLVDLGFCPV